MTGARWLRWLLIGGMLVAMLPLSFVDRLETVVHAASGGAWTLTGNMKEIRNDQTMTLLTSGVNAGKVLVAGGWSSGSPTHEPLPITQPDELYNPTNGTWSYTTTGMVVPRWGHRAALLNDGRVLVAGGLYLGPSSVRQTATAEVYNTNGTWSAVGPMAHARAGFTMTLLADGRVLALAGFDGTVQRSDAEVFSPQTNTWSPIGGLNHLRAGHAATLLNNGKVLVTGGGDGANNPSCAGDGCYQLIAELYDPSTGQSQDFPSAQNLPYGGVLHTQTLLQNGHVLITFLSSPAADTPGFVYEYDPTNASTPFIARGNAVGTSRADHAAIRLADGSVLIAGGSPFVFHNPPSLATAIRFLPTATSAPVFAPVTDMNRARSNVTGVLLPNGAVLIAGGSGDNTSELYTLPTSPPIATLSTTQIAFGGVAVQGTAQRNVSITNTGEDFLVISGISVSPGLDSSGGFTTAFANQQAPTNCASRILATGASCTITVTFLPNAAQSYAATLSFTDNASGSPHTVALSGSGVRQDTLSPTSVSFGAQAVGTADTRVVILTNGGAQTLHISTVSVTPADAFSIGGNSCGQSLASHASCGITVRFQPPAGQPYAATLNVFDDAASGANTASLSGSGSFAGGAAPSFSPTSVDFGNTPLDPSIFSYRAVQLTNAGSQPLTVSSLSLAASGNGGDFAVVDYRCQGKALASGDYCVIYLKFHPAAAGGRSGTLNVYSNANADPSVATTVALSGAGYSGSAPLAHLREEFTDLGSQSVGTTSAAQAVYLQNSGNSPLAITSVGPAGNGGNTGDFSVDATACTGAPVAGGNQCPLSVFFNPTVVGPRKAFFYVNDGASDSPQLLYLAGTATAATGPTVGLSPQQIAFGDQTVGQRSNAATVTLTNGGTQALAITNVAIVGSTDFGQTNTCGSSVAAGASCTFSVRFTPSAQTPRTGAVQITDNASGSPHAIPISGTGAAAGGGTPTLDTNSFRGPVNYGPVSVNGHASGTIHIANSGGGTLVVTSCALSNSDDFSVDDVCSIMVTAGNPVDLHIGGTPRALGTRTTTLTITDNAVGSPHSIQLTENGTGAPIVSLPASLDAGNQPVGTTSGPRAVVLKNTGNVPLTVTSATAGGEFAVASQDCAGVPAGQTCTISVTFTPGQLGPRTGTLTIADDAAGSPHTVALSGTGTPPPPKVARLSTLSVPVAGGTQVTITGSGFQAGAVVFFGESQGAVVGTPTATSIVVATPAHAAGTVNVAVANPDGQYSDVYTGFSFVPPGGVGLPPGQPVVPTVAPKPAPVPIGPQPGAPINGPTPAPVPVSR